MGGETKFVNLSSKAELKTLLQLHRNGCVSIYMPIHRAGPEVQQDPIRLKNLLREAEARLCAGDIRAPEARTILEPAQNLLQNDLFWRYQSDGLALFLAPGAFHYYCLPYEFAELVVVTDRFHLKPLLPLLSSRGRQFFVLAVSQNAVRLLDCTQYEINEIAVENIPSSLTEALKYDDPQRQLQF